MLLTAFIVTQLVFDLAVLALAAVTLIGRATKRRQPAAPWEGSEEFLALAEDLVAALESLPERGDSRASAARRDAPRHARTSAPETAPRPAPETAPRPAPSTAAAAAELTVPTGPGSALALLRAGVPAEEVARRLSLSAGELRLLTSVAEAEGRTGASVPR